MPSGKNRVKLLLLFLALGAGLCYSVSAPAEEIPKEDVVFLVDSSESNSPFLPAIAGIMNRFIGGARAGDSFTCYQFSNNPFLFAKGAITGDADIKSLQKQILNLRHTGRFTNYTSAVQKAMAEIVYYKRKWPSHDRLLIFITDGRGPEDQWTEKSNLMALLQTYSEVKTGSDYFLTCFFLGDKADQDLQSFLNASGGRLVYWPKDKGWLEQLTLGEVRILERDKELRGVSEIPGYSDFKLSFYPRRVPQKLLMIELDIQEDFLQQSLDRLFDIRPRRITVQGQSWTETLALETRGFEKGKYDGRLLFRPSEPQSLLLLPYSIPFQFSVSNSLQVSTPEALNFGPTGLKGSYQEVRYIYVNFGHADVPAGAASIKATPFISLPEGFHLEISPVSREEEIIFNIKLSRDEEAPRAAKNRYDGTIKLTSSTGWVLTQRELPISVLVENESTHNGLFAVYAVAGVAAVLLGFASLVLIRGVRRTSVLLSRNANPVGKIFAVKDPMRELPKSINLGKISEKANRKEVLVGGTGANADIVISHISMVDKLFRFSGFRTGTHVETLLEVSQGASQIIINGVTRLPGKIPLKNLDLIKMGAIEFKYEEPVLLHQVVLYYLNEEVKQGWLLNWNTKAESFRLAARERGKNASEIEVRFDKLKAVAFLRDFEGELTDYLLSLRIPRRGHLVKIVFLDQEELTGYVFDWQDPGDRFYFVPKEMSPNIMFFLIERAAVKTLKVLKENEMAAKAGARRFSRILKRIS